jgi:hypothetical protein
MKRYLVAALLLLSLAGCRNTVSALDVKDSRVAYQQIADALPDASFGWGQAPGIVQMSARAKADGPVLEPEPLSCNERGFRIHYQVYRPQSVWIPYSAIKEVFWEWKPFPNVLFAATIVLPMQSVRATVVFDANQVHGLIRKLSDDAKILEDIGRTVGVGSPWSHAQNVKWKIEDDRIEYGEGMLTVHFDSISMIPAWFPWGGKAERTAEAFEWAKANPDLPILEGQPDDDEETTEAGD